MKLLRVLIRVVIVLFVILNIMAAFHAYKFTHFYSDKEVAKTKIDEMSAWEKAKTILFGINYIKSKNLVVPDTAYQKVELITADSLRIRGWYLKNDNAKGTAILFHGHGSSKSKILNEAYYMYSLGYNIMMNDFRAHGDSDGRTCTIGFDEAEEVKLAVDEVRRTGEKNIYLWGISMGAASITSAINKYDLNPKGVILELPFGTLKEAVKGRVRIMGLPQEPVSTLLTFWGGAEQGFWAFNHNPADYAKKINCPVLLQSGAKDPRVTRAEIDAIYNNLPGANKKLVVYENSAHESLCDKEPVKWRKEISGFLARK